MWYSHRSMCHDKSVINTVFVLQCGKMCRTLKCMQARGDSSDEVTEAQLLEMIRNGSHPLDAYGIPSEVTKVSLVLAKVLQQCQVFFGSYRTVNTNK